MERPRLNPEDVPNNWDDLSIEEWGQRILAQAQLAVPQQEPTPPPEEDPWDKADREEAEKLQAERRQKDQDLQEFQELSDACAEVEREIDRLAGPERGEKLRVPGSTDEEHGAIQKLAEEARKVLVLTQLEQGRDLCRKLAALIETTKQEVTRRAELERVAQQQDIDALARIFNRMQILTGPEWRELNGLRQQATDAVRTGSPTAPDLIEALRTAIVRASTRTDPETLLARFNDKRSDRYKGRPELIETYKACIEAGITFVPELKRLEMLKLGLADSAGAKPNYDRIDTATGRDHAYDRHTREGIWDVGDVLTAHPSSVAIFRSVQDLEDAVRTAPTLRTAWRSQGGGRVDADVRNVHYQGIELGNTVSLTSVYPTNLNYPKEDVARLLQRMRRERKGFRDFCDELAKL